MEYSKWYLDVNFFISQPHCISHFCLIPKGRNVVKLFNLESPLLREILDFTNLVIQNMVPVVHLRDKDNFGRLLCKGTIDISGLQIGQGSQASAPIMLHKGRKDLINFDMGVARR